MDLESTTDLSPVTNDTDRVLPDIVHTPDLEPGDSMPPSGFAARELPGLGRQLPAGPRPLAPGAILCDRFILERILGNGGTAVVFQARDMTSAGTAPGK